MQMQTRRIRFPGTTQQYTAMVCPSLIRGSDFWGKDISAVESWGRAPIYPEKLNTAAIYPIMGTPGFSSPFLFLGFSNIIFVNHCLLVLYRILCISLTTMIWSHCTILFYVFYAFAFSLAVDDLFTYFILTRIHAHVFKNSATAVDGRGV